MLSSNVAWVDQSVFSISNWHPSFFPSRDWHSMQCVTMYFRHSHIEYAKWKFVQCNASMPIIDILCKTNLHKAELQIPTSSNINSIVPMPKDTYTFIEIRQPASGKQIQQNFLILQKSLISCSMNWTFIMAHCYRITHSDHQPQGQRHQTNLPWTTLESDAKYVQRHIFAYLEYIYQTNTSLHVRIQGKCNYWVRKTYNKATKWKKESNCCKIFKIHVALIIVTKTSDDICLKGYLMKGSCYFISEIKPRTKLAYIPIFTADPQYNTALFLASYLNKLPTKIKLLGILVNALQDECEVYSVDFGYELPGWTIEFRHCNSTSYILNRQDAVRISNPDNCRNHQYQCDDGTCISEHYHCDGADDCPDKSDEKDCDLACDTVDQAICFHSCHYPGCHCTFPYFQCKDGPCIPMSKLCDGIQQCWGGEDESQCQILYKMRPGLKTIHDNHSLFPQWQFAKSHDEGYKHELMNTDFACLFNKEVVRLDIHLESHLSYCLYHQCPGLYKCHLTYCIPYWYICDGQNDCPSGEDERYCTSLTYPGLLRCSLEKCACPGLRSVMVFAIVQCHVMMK